MRHLAKGMYILSGAKINLHRSRRRVFCKRKRLNITLTVIDNSNGDRISSIGIARENYTN